MSFGFSQKLIAAAIEEVTEKHRANSRANEEILQNAAMRRVAVAYERAMHHHHNNPLPQWTDDDRHMPLSTEFGTPAMLKSDIEKTHRAALIYSFTMAGVSHATAELIVDQDILEGKHA